MKGKNAWWFKAKGFEKFKVVRRTQKKGEEFARLEVFTPDQKRIAEIRISQIGKRAALLSSLFVEKNYRRKGIAMHLIEKAIDVSRRKGLHFIFAVAENEASAKLLQKLHFTYSGGKLFYKNLKEQF